MIPRRWRPSLILSRLRPMPRTESGPKKYVLFAKQRSGSTWVIDLLNSHPDVVGFSELFDYDCWGKDQLVGGEVGLPCWNTFVADFYARHNREPNRADQVLLYPEYLNKVVYSKARAAKAVGFKLMYNQALSHPAIPRYLQRQAVHCVHLIRRNHLDGIVSHEAVANRGFAHAGAQAKSQATIIDAASILLRIQRRARDVHAAREFTQFLRLPTTEIFYEDLTHDVSGMNPVLDALGVEVSSASLATKLKKLSSNSHRDTIANYDEIAAALSNTPYESLLRP